MENWPHSEKLQYRVMLACTAGVVLLALFALFCWRFDLRTLAAMGRDYVPMAPSTACMLLLLGSALFMSRRLPSNPFAVRFAYLSIFCTILMGLVVVLQGWLGSEPSLERWLTPSSIRAAGAPVGRMSLVTAGVFLASSLALLGELAPLGKRRSWRQYSALCALISLTASLIVLFSYIIDAPLLYGGQVIPMALPTSIAFSLLGTVLLLNAGNDSWPLALFVPDSAVTPPSSCRSVVRGPLAPFLLLTLAIATAGGLHLKKQMTQFRQAAQNELSAIAELKSAQIARWYGERRDDAEVLFHNPLIQSRLFTYLNGSADTRLTGDIQAWLDYRQTKGVRRLVLFDATGALRLRAPSDNPLPRHDYRNEIRTIMTSRTVLITDLHRDVGGPADVPPEISLNIWIPVGIDRESGGQATGALLLQIDPHRFLYPLIQSWPTISSSAETLLVRREDDDVVFLNELRHRTGVALSQRFKLGSSERLPAAMAVKGRTGVVEGMDYRNVTVLAALCAVPGTPWFMVAKMDREEVYAPLQQQAWKTGGIMCAMVLAAAFGVSLLWKQRDNQLLRNQLVIELERTRLEDELSRLNDDLEQRVRERTAQLELANKELEAFAYSVSHDLRAPLRGMSGFVELLRKRAAATLDDKERHYLEVITDSARSMGELIDDLLSFSRMGRAEMAAAVLDLNQAVEDSRRRLQADAAGREIDWQVAHLPLVHGDAAMLGLVFDNLLGNALKFTRTRTNTRIEIGWHADPEHGDVAIFIRDNGVGFNMKYMDKLFGLFQRLHRSEEFEGTGVGLANVRRIISRHGGRTWAEGGVDEGATFYFSLPVKEV